jgi:hypothetical protein
MSNAEILSAAIHEAGHFVFAARQQQTPDLLAMEFDAARSCWIGQTELPPTGHLSVESNFVTSFGYCFSGCFAQVKYAIELLDPQAGVPWSDLFRWVESDASKPLSLPISGGRMLIVPSAWFDPQDAETFRENAGAAKFCLPDWESYGNYVYEAFKLTIGVMEDPLSWEKIERLAVKLASSISQQRACLRLHELAST